MCLRPLRGGSGQREGRADNLGMLRTYQRVLVFALEACGNEALRKEERGEREKVGESRVAVSFKVEKERAGCVVARVLHQASRRGGESAAAEVEFFAIPRAESARTAWIHSQPPPASRVGALQDPSMPLPWVARRLIDSRGPPDQQFPQHIDVPKYRIN